MRPLSPIPPKAASTPAKNTQAITADSDSGLDEDLASAKENLEAARRNHKTGQKNLRSAEYERKAYLNNAPSAINPRELEDMNHLVFRRADSLHLMENRLRVAELKVQALQAPKPSGARAIPEYSGAILPIDLNRTPHPPAVSKTGRIAPDFFVPNHTPFDTHLGPNRLDLTKIKSNVEKHRTEVESAQLEFNQEIGSFTTSHLNHAEQAHRDAKKGLEAARIELASGDKGLELAVFERTALRNDSPGYFHDLEMELQNIHVQTKTDNLGKLEAKTHAAEAKLDLRETELAEARKHHGKPIPAEMDGLPDAVVAAKTKLETAQRNLRASQYQERNFHQANDRYFGIPPKE